MSDHRDVAELLAVAVMTFLVHPPPRCGEDGSLRSRADTEATEDASHVPFDGAHADAELVSDLFVVEPE